MRSLLALLLAAPLLAAPRFEQVDLFRQGDAGVHTYRIPALLETRKGTLLAVVDARHDSTRDLPARISLVMRRSTDRGRTWSEARTIRKVTEGGVGDPSLLLDRRTGRVWCFHAYGAPGIGFDNGKPGVVTGPTTLQVHAMWSDDDGLSWSEPVDLTPQIKDPQWIGMFATSGTHIETSRGRFLVPMVVMVARKQMCSRNAYSDDRGKTWKIGPCIGVGTDESHAVELKDGTIMQNMRAGKKRAIARSKDGGVTFDAVSYDEALVDPNCNAGIMRRVRGREDVLIFTNAASQKREKLTVKISRDEGRTWPESRLLEPGLASYSTVIALRDGTIAVLYERGEKWAAERVTFARFDRKWVSAYSK